MPGEEKQRQHKGPFQAHPSLGEYLCLDTFYEAARSGRPARRGIARAARATLFANTVLRCRCRRVQSIPSKRGGGTPCCRAAVRANEPRNPSSHKTSPRCSTEPQPCPQDPRTTTQRKNNHRKRKKRDEKRERGSRRDRDDSGTRPVHTCWYLFLTTASF